MAESFQPPPQDGDPTMPAINAIWQTLRSDDAELAEAQSGAYAERGLPPGDIIKNATLARLANYFSETVSAGAAMKNAVNDRLKTYLESELASPDLHFIDPIHFMTLTDIYEILINDAVRSNDVARVDDFTRKFMELKNEAFVDRWGPLGYLYAKAALAGSTVAYEALAEELKELSKVNKYILTDIGGRHSSLLGAASALAEAGKPPHYIELVNERLTNDADRLKYLVHYLAAGKETVPPEMREQYEREAAALYFALPDRYALEAYGHRHFPVANVITSEELKGVAFQRCIDILKADQDGSDVEFYTILKLLEHHTDTLPPSPSEAEWHRLNELVNYAEATFGTNAHYDTSTSIRIAIATGADARQVADMAREGMSPSPHVPPGTGGLAEIKSILNGPTRFVDPEYLEHVATVSDNNHAKYAEHFARRGDLAGARLLLGGITDVGTLLQATNACLQYAKSKDEKLNLLIEAPGMAESHIYARTLQAKQDGDLEALKTLAREIVWLPGESPTLVNMNPNRLRVYLLDDTLESLPPQDRKELVSNLLRDIKVESLSKQLGGVEGRRLRSLFDSLNNWVQAGDTETKARVEQAIGAIDSGIVTEDSIYELIMFARKQD